jgi:hypothetical protein
VPIFFPLLNDQSAKRAPGIPKQKFAERGQCSGAPNDDGNVLAATLGD